MISRRIARRSLAVVLTAMIALPIGTAGSAGATGATGAAGGVETVGGAQTAGAPRPVAPASGPAEGELVPGVPPGPYQPWQIDTPDQGLAPIVYRPSAAEDAVEPRDAAEGTYDLVEYVPLGDAVGKVACSKRTGPYQWEVERWLRLKADGRQSAADCRAVRAFQLREGIKPSSGFAGPVTWARMQLRGARKNPNAAGRCPVRSYQVACVDLDRQLTWVQRGRKVVFGPVPVRSGRNAHPTRLGWHRIYWKHKNHWSTLYNSPMPYAQFFDKGIAFHAVYGSLYTSVGSWGCVNLQFGDARALWNVLRNGDRVYVWGHRSGK
ncbi:L,D-transpeptidase [Streptomyces sp. NPDC005423]|uniref:L,D-transpeptidase family protein n=1 Tax=Streptomyces sp. NPDC005423 TaxID=3155343 RepID=UPI00339E10A3